MDQKQTVFQDFHLVGLKPNQNPDAKLARQHFGPADDDGRTVEN
jgi:hypothetical protein